MFVNDSQTRDGCDHVKIKFARNASCTVSSTAAKEESNRQATTRGRAPGGGHKRDWRWLAPGQEAVYRVKIT